MNISKIAKKIEDRGIEVKRDELMKIHTTFKIGGPIAAMVLPKSFKELQTTLSVIRSCEEEPFVFGNGSNLLVSDEPIDKVAVKTCYATSKMLPEGETGIAAGSGVLLSKIAVFAREMGLAGMEFAHGIPGTLGGAITMNAGAYGGQISDILRMVTIIDENGERKHLDVSKLDLGYRHSIFSDPNNKYVIAGASIELVQGDFDEIRSKMNELSKKRRDSQPLDLPSAGSTFKRPEKGYAAAMIEEAGLKGYTVGGAQVSEKHAGFVVNRGDATFSDVMNVIEHVYETVYNRFGVHLEPEVRIIK